MTYIIVLPDNKIKLLSLPKGTIKQRALKRTMSSHPDGSRVFDYDKDFPPLPSEAWLWDDSTETIIIDEAWVKPPNWAGLMADFIGLDPDMKIKLGSGYISIIQATLEEDEIYLLRVYVSRETSLNDKEREMLKSILTLHNVNLDQWIDNIPF